MKPSNIACVVFMIVGACIVGASFVYLMVVPEADGGGLGNMGSNLNFIGLIVGGGLLLLAVGVLWIVYNFFWKSSPTAPSQSEADDEESR